MKTNYELLINEISIRKIHKNIVINRNRISNEVPFIGYIDFFTDWDEILKKTYDSSKEKLNKMQTIADEQYYMFPININNYSFMLQININPLDNIWTKNKSNIETMDRNDFINQIYINDIDETQDIVTSFESPLLVVPLISTVNKEKYTVVDGNHRAIEMLKKMDEKFSVYKFDVDTLLDSNSFMFSFEKAIYAYFYELDKINKTLMSNQLVNYDRNSSLTSVFNK